MFKINEKRLARQKEFIDKWISVHGVGCLEACTGFGKSYVGVLIGKLANERHPLDQIHIVVPSKYLKSKWEADVIMHDLKNTKVFVINTYVKENRSCSLLILDEVHRYAAATFRKVFKVSQYKWILGLTATMERSDDNHYIVESHVPILDTISLLEAEEEGFVAKHEVYNVPVHLDISAKEQYNKVQGTFESTFRRFSFDYELARACMVANNSYAKISKSRNFPEMSGVTMSGSQWRKWYSEHMGYNEIEDDDAENPHPFSPRELQKAAAQFNWAVNERKSLIYKADCKIDAAIEIIKKYPNKKFITFAQEIESVEMLNDRLLKENILAKVYHSKLTKKQKDTALTAFNKGAYRVLNTAKALDEGFDVHDIDITLQLSYTSTKRQNIQRVGRGIRFKEGKIGLAINLFLVGTQEEQWLRSKQSGMGGKPVHTVEQISDLPKI